MHIVPGLVLLWCVLLSSGCGLSYVYTEDRCSSFETALGTKVYGTSQLNMKWDMLTEDYFLHHKEVSATPPPFLLARLHPWHDRLSKITVLRFTFWLKFHHLSHVLDGISSRFSTKVHLYQMLLCFVGFSFYMSSTITRFNPQTSSFNPNTCRIVPTSPSAASAFYVKSPPTAMSPPLFRSPPAGAGFGIDTNIPNSLVLFHKTFRLTNVSGAPLLQLKYKSSVFLTIWAQQFFSKRSVMESRVH